MENRQTFVASASEIQRSDIYMTIKTPMFTVPKPNLNNVACTEAFLDEIVANQDKYVCLPLFADVTNLVHGKYNKLGHGYDSKTNTFSTAQVGSFYKFEKEELANGEKALVGYARVARRFGSVCKAIGELFAEGNLKFSFEISCGECIERDDGVVVIDASEKNQIEGEAIVSFPACPEATAMALVAELSMSGKEAEDMEKENEIVETAAETAGVIDVKEVIESKAEEVEAPAVEETPVEETKEENEAPAAEQEVVETPVEEMAPAAEETPAEEVPAEMKAEDEEVASEKDKENEDEEEEDEETAACGKKKKAEVDIENLISEIESLKAVIASLKESQETYFTASKKEEVQINPFIAEISAPSKYSLLDKAEEQEKKPYTLL